ncbi:hypothetical protein DEI97_008555 [Curtobacterium sp. MCLR17_032]|uniref:hypothetical protein n=1 Tax=Curtobacterium sp. MCLR17_032 TaxID=2175650 RepID=UPI000DA8ED7A|nr:hypothetical protein [Curtobacterium sp. MCLR17_032]WIE63177.1 hypothetical protein DEI97_008555 [Curtobacterium sp. MCLR17_032]
MSAHTKGMRINDKAIAHLTKTTKAPGPVSLIIGLVFSLALPAGIFLWLTIGRPTAAVVFATCAVLYAVSLITVPVETAVARRRR